MPTSSAQTVFLRGRGQGSSTDTSDPSASSVGSPLVNSPAHTALTTNGSGDIIPPCPSDAAEWFSKVYREVSQCNLGGGFNALLGVLIDLERTYKWDKGTKGGKGLSTLNCPLQLSVWITAGRGGRGGVLGNGVGPTIASLAVYDTNWWKWWDGLQPAWRIADRGRPGRFIRDVYPAGKPEDTYLPTHHPGPNGALSLVATLYWWGGKVREDGRQEELESWVDAVTDVKWMLRGLLAAELKAQKWTS
ncbi:hypothetical protein DFH07DRAFT_750702 [Mycena maculata]|uniref:Uncharacterized protein n=1 Tax=Mycena maculata TaxID=230809 RepID=A0AAD7N1Y1_9AGAR|nr:hypothetical protein DFH07DRAFT_750702 [Mycena maculata]